MYIAYSLYLLSFNYCLHAKDANSFMLFNQCHTGPDPGFVERGFKFIKGFDLLILPD